MPVYIPYSHPSLQIGSVVDTSLLNQFKQLNDLQQQIDTAHDGLNSLIMMKRSLTMTVNELSDMQVDTTPVTTELANINEHITTAATNYMQKRIANETEMQKIRDEMQKTSVLENVESIIDFGASQYEARPFATDSLNLDSQFFSFGSNIQDDMIANIEKFIRSSTGAIPNVSDKTAQAASMQLMNQVQNHSISGTLIIVASCQHRNIGIFNPLVIDTDKAIQVWNALHPKNKIDPKLDLLKNKDDGDDSISIVTGASYGSSFVGMAHILQSDNMQMDDYENLKTSFDEKIKLGGWLANATGGFGVSEDALKDIRAFISSKSINCHVSTITVGATISLAANITDRVTENGVGVKNDVMQRTMNLGHSENSSVDSEARAAAQKALLVNVENSRVTQIMEKAQTLDEKANNTLNINSLMTAFGNYIAAISSKDLITGTPVSFSIKKLTKGDIIQLLIRAVNPEKEKTGAKQNSAAIQK